MHFLSFATRTLRLWLRAMTSTYDLHASPLSPTAAQEPQCAWPISGLHETQPPLLEDRHALNETRNTSQPTQAVDQQITSTTITNTTKKRQTMITKECLLCGKMVSVYPTNDYPLSRHMGSEDCQRRQRKLEQQKAEIASHSLPRGCSESPSRSVPIAPEPLHRRAVSDSDILASFILPPARSPSPNIDRSSSAPVELPDSSGDEVGHEDRNQVRPCPGVRLPWLPGSLHSRYPFSIHGTQHDPGYQLLRFRKMGRGLVVRANDCTKVIAGWNGECCPECHRVPISAGFKAIVKRASEAKPHTPYSLLNHEQMCKKAEGSGKQLKDIQLEVSLTLQTRL